MSLNEEKPGPFVWFSPLQCRRFGRESVSYSVNKLGGKFRINPRLGRSGFEEPGPERFLTNVAVQQFSFPVPGSPTVDRSWTETGRLDRTGDRELVREHERDWVRALSRSSPVLHSKFSTAPLFEKLEKSKGHHGPEPSACHADKRIKGVGVSVSRGDDCTSSFTL